MTTQTIHHGDALTILRSLPANSVHCIVTSPPYYGLRDYGVPGQIGMEETIAAYVAKMVEVFEECRRVLRDDGTLWLNLGDSYAGSGGAGEWSRRKAGKQEYAGPRGNNVNRTAACGLKPKDLIGIPWRIAFALQEAGWWLRADIIWAKANPMPESVTDRPTRSHEHIFLFAKSSRYYYDADAVAEPAAVWTGQAATFERTGPVSEHIIPGQSAAVHRQNRNGHNAPRGQGSNRSDPNGPALRAGRDTSEIGAGPTRNCRSVWTIATRPYPAAHFAVFPTEIPRRAILAGTSEKGCCPACGSPWKRTTARQFRPQSDIRDAAKLAKSGRKGLDGSNGWGETPRGTVSSTTTGWTPTCACGMPDAIPCTVLDPFLGSGTTLAVAASLGRAGIGIELNPDYIELARQRIEKQQLPLPLA